MVRNPRPVSFGRVWTRRGVHGAVSCARNRSTLRDAVSESERHLARARTRSSLRAFPGPTPRVSRSRRRLAFRSIPARVPSRARRVPRRAPNVGRSTSGNAGREALRRRKTRRFSLRAFETKSARKARLSRAAPGRLADTRIRLDLFVAPKRRTTTDLSLNPTPPSGMSSFRRPNRRRRRSASTSNPRA